MNAERLLAQFERIADAPDAVPRLRRLILDLAVRGKLVEQNPKDEPASKLLLHRVFQPTPEQEAWELPSGWSWSSFSLIGDTIGGGTPSKTNPEYWTGRIPWVSPKDMKVDLIDDAQDHISEEAIANSSTRLIPAGSLLMVVRGMILAHSFPTAIAKVPVTINQDMKAIVPFQDGLSEPLLLIAKGMKPEVMRLVLRSTHGTCKLLTDDLFSLPIPIPPLAEQHRIVAKVDELMALCDRLEAAQVERESRRDRLVTASLHCLNQPTEDATAFRDDVRFALDHLTRFTTQPEHIPQFRQTILNLAVRGKLVPQDPKDEPAESALSHIRRRRSQLYAEKAIPKPTALPDVTEVDLPFSVPPGWQWVLLGELCYKVADGPHHSPQYVGPENGVPFLSTRNVRLDRFDLTSVKYISRQDHETFIKKAKPEVGDIIYTKGGTTGIARVNDLNFEFSVWVHLAVLKIAKDFVYPQFVAMALNSPLCYEQSQKYTQGTSNFDLGLTRMIKILIPIPPINEQRRIVAKVDELMALCDRLEAQLTTTQTEGRRLLEAVLHEALSVTSERRET